MGGLFFYENFNLSVCMQSDKERKIKMFQGEIEKSLKILTKHGILLEAGMSEEEVLAAEKCYDLKFPLDYRAFLMAALPFDDEFDENDCWSNFTNWRNLSEEYVSNIKSKMFDWTIDGVLYTAELGGWLDEWGVQPENAEEKTELIKAKVRENPLFIPIIANKFLALGGQTDNPVYSIHDGIDVICYGKNIWDFIEKRYSDNNGQTVDLKAISEPVPRYNEFVWHSINNFFYQGRRYYDEHGKYLDSAVSEDLSK